MKPLRSLLVMALLPVIVACRPYAHESEVVVASQLKQPAPRESLYGFQAHTSPPWDTVFDRTRALARRSGDGLAVEILATRTGRGSAAMAACGLGGQGLVLRDCQGRPAWSSQQPEAILRRLDELEAQYAAR